MANELKNILDEGGNKAMTNEEKVLDTTIEESQDTDFVKKEDEEKKAVPGEDQTEEKKEETKEDTTKDEKEEDKKEDSKEEDDEKKKKTNYSLEEDETYIALKKSFDELNQSFAAQAKELEDLRAFKNEIQLKEKEAMIAKFYMLSDEDKKDVVDNINTYSLDDIEAKLSVICVRNKVSFAEESTTEEENKLTDYSFIPAEVVDNAPEWIKAVRNTQNKL